MEQSGENTRNCDRSNSQKEQECQVGHTQPGYPKLLQKSQYILEYTQESAHVGDPDHALHKHSSMCSITCTNFNYPVKVACVMVGLPARGKTYIARKIARYFDWLGYPTKVFNVGNYRRDAVGAQQFAHFFNPDNPEYVRQRLEVALAALDDMLKWFSEEEEKLNDIVLERTQAAASSSYSFQDGSVRAGGSGFVAVYDATNSTKDRRKIIHDTCIKNGVQVLFIESVCDDVDVVMSNIREVKISSPDYIGVDPRQAVQDFMKRIKQYEKVYETLDVKEEVPFIRLISVGKQVQMNLIRGYIQSRIVYLLMNLNITPRHIYFSRHGESQFNVEGKIGGDSDLSTAGWAYSELLPITFQNISAVKSKIFSGPSCNVRQDSDNSRGLIMQAREFKVADSNAPSPSCQVPATPIPSEPEKVTVWTSTMKRTLQTSSKLPYVKMQWKQLDELDSGVCDGLTYETIEALFPEDFHERDLDKFNYRYKGGESYRDLVQRLEPVIMELERHNEPNHSIFIIGHQAVLRCIYAYFLDYSPSELPYIEIPLHTIFKLTPKAYECQIESYRVDIPAVNTHRVKPKSNASSPTMNHPEE